MYKTNSRVSKHMENLIEQKGEIAKFIVLFEEFSTPFAVTDKKEKVNKISKSMED